MLALGQDIAPLEAPGKEREIFVVDDEFVDLDIAEDACGPDFKVVGHETVAMMIEAVKKGRVPEIIFLDCDLPDTDGFDALEILKNNPLTKSVPV
ncbi:MAG: response regulator, partial [Deltaproteobacteria bacterium]|nr:response regulator [Deltaproteobacteria bacterium]